MSNQLQNLLTRLTASIYQVVHPFLSLSTLDVSGAYKLSNNFFRPSSCDLPEHCASFKVLLDSFITRHETTVS